MTMIIPVLTGPGLRVEKSSESSRATGGKRQNCKDSEVKRLSEVAGPALVGFRERCGRAAGAGRGHRGQDDMQVD